jgi:4-hydroxybenzoate polyprenyltransferase
MPERLSLYLSLIRWNRPAGWLLLLWPTLGALWVAAKGFPGWHLVAVFTLGTFLMRSAGCCVNDVVDQDFDRHVKRTAQRPVTSGAVSSREALALGALLALVAFGLVLSTNLNTVLWSLAALAVTLLYPFAKRHVAMPQAVLGLAFSMGIPMAFSAVTPGSGGVPLDLAGLVLGLVVANGCWVRAYDTEYAMVDRDDDLKIGMRTSAITLGRFDVAAVMAFYGLSLALWGGLMTPFLTKWALTMGLFIAAAQVLWHFGLIRQRQRAGCFKAFTANHWLGFALFAATVLGYGAPELI